ncbi:MAG: DUF362 domain-containing protein [Candidatus Magnetominusculus sp. LBB02]|nr:DUF362 domain-containing protein [Candidatus Magnetominusculus sp. LBB02]
MPSKLNTKARSLSRREFLIKLSTAAAASAVCGAAALVFHSDEPVKRQSSKIYTFKNYRVEGISAALPKLAIVHGKDAAKMVRAAVDKLGGISQFIKPSDRVLIKPNCGWDRQPELAANTNPDVVAALVQLCIEAKAASVWVTDVSINDPYRSFARSGIEAAVTKAGGKVKFTTNNDFLDTDLKGEALKVWPVSAFFHQVDKVINVPIAKHHSLSKCTLSMKNLYGTLGGQRNRLHQDINTSIADLAFAIRATLTVMDATRILKTNGPTGGSISDVATGDTIIAGTDDVAIDTYTMSFLDLKAADVPYIQMAERRGVGISDWKSLAPAEFTV